MRIGQLLVTDPEFDAFCMDFFPAIFHRYSRGMDRIEKTNLLLVHGKLDEIEHCLDNHLNEGVQNLAETMQKRDIVASPNIDTPAIPRTVRAVRPKAGWP